MCAIAGVSFAPGSTINRPRLATALLSAGERRGRDASGFAAIAPNGEQVLYKKDIPGSKLHVGKIPADATAMILHTRASTHGSPRNNNNNHPIVSPGGTITLVHNGVIYNHDEMRGLLGKDIEKMLPEVDSSVIGAMIETYGLDSTEHIQGYAACAWFDTETGDTIHLAKFCDSPVAFATLEDGSFAFASTPEILATALRRCGIRWIGFWPDAFATMTQGEYFQINEGSLINEAEVEWDDMYDSKKYSSYGWQAITSGATTQAAARAGASKGANDGTAMALQGESGVVVYNGSGEQLSGPELEEWMNQGLPGFDDPIGAPAESDYDDPEYEVASGEDGFRPIFFTIDHGGDYATYTTMHGLLSALRWHAGLSISEEVLVGPEDGELRWINHFADIGHLDHETGAEKSWVVSRENETVYEILVPSFVREGVSKLRQLVGA